jgi:hypothetical protein
MLTVNIIFENQNYSEVADTRAVTVFVDMASCLFWLHNSALHEQCATAVFTHIIYDVFLREADITYVNVTVQYNCNIHAPLFPEHICMI